MATRAALVRQTLMELGVWQSGQDLPPEDYRVVDQELPYRLAAMAKARIYAVDSPDIIPDEALNELARYLAGEYAQIFGLGDVELKDVQQNAALGERALRFLRTRLPTYSQMKSDYF